MIGNRRNIHGVTSIGFESADAALAQNHVVVAARHDVFGGEQQFFQRGRDAALEQHRLLDLAQLAQQVEVLHVAGADLEDVDVRQHQRDLRDLHHLADHQQAEMRRRPRATTSAFFAHVPETSKASCAV